MAQYSYVRVLVSHDVELDRHALVLRDTRRWTHLGHCFDDIALPSHHHCWRKRSHSSLLGPSRSIGASWGDNRAHALCTTLHSSTCTLGITLGNSHQVDIFDVIIHCYSSIAIFVAAKVYRSRHLIGSSTEPITTVPCEVFFRGAISSPDEATLPSIASVPRVEVAVIAWKSVHTSAPPVIDGNNLLIGIPWPRCLGAIVNLVGCNGKMIGWVTMSWYVVHSHILLRQSTVQLALAVVSCASSLICFAFTSLMHSVSFSCVTSDRSTLDLSHSNSPSSLLSFRMYSLGTSVSGLFGRPGSAARIATIWLWMGRFLQRELFYPRGAFKLLKYLVQYHIPQDKMVQPSD